MSQTESPSAPEVYDDEECVAEFIDGSWTTAMCPCEDCQDIEAQNSLDYGGADAWADESQW